MNFELRLFEDNGFAGAKEVLSPALPRAIYVASGEVTINGCVLPSDEGIVATDSLTLLFGDTAATLWRWEVEAAVFVILEAGYNFSMQLSGALNVGGRVV